MSLGQGRDKNHPEEQWERPLRRGEEKGEIHYLIRARGGESLQKEAGFGRKTQGESGTFSRSPPENFGTSHWIFWGVVGF